MKTTYKLDTIIKVDESLCIGCGSCIRACPGGLITKKDFPVPIENSWDLCIDCGHCVAICPTGAMHQIQLAAPALALGTTFTGSINTAAQGYPLMIDLLGIPEGYIPFGTFVIGYPAERYLRIPVRKPVNAIWV